MTLLPRNGAWWEPFSSKTFSSYAISYQDVDGFKTSVGVIHLSLWTGYFSKTGHFSGDIIDVRAHLKNSENNFFTKNKSVVSFRRPWLLVNFTIRAVSNDCRKTKTKVITLTNHNRKKQRQKPGRIPSNYLKLVRSAGKITRSWCDWFWLYFSLVWKTVASLWSQSPSVAIAITPLFSTVILKTVIISVCDGLGNVIVDPLLMFSYIYWYAR